MTTFEQAAKAWLVIYAALGLLMVSAMFRIYLRELRRDLRKWIDRLRR